MTPPPVRNDPLRGSAVKDGRTSGGVIINEIVKSKKAQIKLLKKKRPLAVLKKEVSVLPKKPQIFLKSLQRGKDVAVIAEIKRQSPSKGVLREEFDPVLLARIFERYGARALSVLTDEKFFGGASQVLKDVRSACSLPILRKDFILDEYQVWESRLLGADAVLLIASLLPVRALRELADLAKRLGLDVLLEIHTLEDAEKTMALRPELVGINNRDLRDFHVDLRVTARLVRLLRRSYFLVSESGIQTHQDLLYLQKLGVRAALVGESLMREPHVGLALKRLLDG